MGSKSVGHNWTTKQQQQDNNNQEMRLGSAQIETSYFPFSKSRRPSQLESSLEVKKSSDAKLPIGLFAGIHLGWKMHARTHTYTQEDPKTNQIRAQNQANQNDWPKETWKRCPHVTDFKYHKGVTLSMGLPASIHMDYTPSS